MSSVLAWSTAVALLVLNLAMACAVFRMLRGPRAQDRIAASDNLYVNAMLVLMTLGIRSSSAVYYDGALIIAVLGFAGTVAFAKFLLRGGVIE